MKGVILAGGTGSRLYPLTKVTNKHLLPVYNKPMIYYPLYALKEAGIEDVLIVSGTGHAGNFLELLGAGSCIGMRITYEVQEKALGISHALSLARNFAGCENIVVILGDNLFEDSLRGAVDEFRNVKEGAKIFLKEVANPSSYGVAEIENDGVKNIIEKPFNPISNLAVTGCYMYDNSVFEIIDGLKPSARNELEITDVNNHYLSAGKLYYEVLEGFWGDCGESFNSLMDASRMVKNSHLALIDDNLSLRSHKNLTSNNFEEHSALRISSL